jgi:hypothetical protein
MRSELLAAIEKIVRSPRRDTQTLDGWLILDFEFASDDEGVRLVKLLDSMKSQDGTFTFILMKKLIG